MKEKKKMKKIINEKFVEELWQEYNNRHSVELDTFELREEQATLGALLVGLERLLNKEPYTLISEATKREG